MSSKNGSRKWAGAALVAVPLLALIIYGTVWKPADQLVARRTRPRVQHEEPASRGVPGIPPRQATAPIPVSAPVAPPPMPKQEDFPVLPVPKADRDFLESIEEYRGDPAALTDTPVGNFYLDPFYPEVEREVIAYSERVEKMTGEPQILEVTLMSLKAKNFPAYVEYVRELMNKAGAGGN